jgi:hypothetical protein
MQKIFSKSRKSGRTSKKLINPITKKEKLIAPTIAMTKRIRLPQKKH